MKHTDNIIEALGVDAIAAAVDCKRKTVTVVKYRGHFPPAWYPIIKGMCDDAGIDCPDSAFKFKFPPETGGSSQKVAPSFLGENANAI